MKYFEWQQKIFEEFSLQEDIEEFRNSDKQVRYIDRHIIDGINDIPELADYDGYWAVCKVGIEILKRWMEIIESLPDNSVMVIRPYFVIDGEWLNKEENPPPPHIYTTLAKHSRFLRPHVFYNAQFESPDSNSELGQLIVGTGIDRFRLAETEESAGAWVLMFDHW